MSTNTTNYNLVKPEYSDDADIADINGNMDIIDAQMKTNADGITTNASNITTLNSSVSTINSNITSLSGSKQDKLNKGTVAQNTNLNSITTPGQYWLNSTYSNLPHTGTAAGILEVLQPNDTVLIQRYTRFQGANYAVYNIFYRVYVSGSWYAWKTALIIN